MSSNPVWQLRKPHAPQFPIVGGLRCVSIMVPDDDEYVQALAGLYSQMTQRGFWFGTIEEITERADLVLEAYTATDWEGCMDCEQVGDCIENDEGVREIILDLVGEGTEIPANYPYGQNLTSGRMNHNLVGSTNPTCDKDILFGQCYGVVDTINSFIENTLAKIEVTTNAVELVKSALGTIPAVAGVEKFAGIDGALDLINYYQEAIAEEYTAQYTVTPGGVRDIITCALFCECSDDCAITIQRIFNVMEARMAVYLSPPSLDGLLDLLEFLAGLSFDETFVVDVAFFVAAGMMKVSNWLFGDAANNILDMVIALKKDEPSNDWVTLCPECVDGPFISLVETFPLSFDNNPVFLGNTETGGSIWEATYAEAAPGVYVVAVSSQIGGMDVCCKLIEASPVDSYQHLDCADSLVGGAGDGASPPDWKDLGFIRSTGGVITIELEPA